jgi:3-hydroxyacyl-[acyl-carrier-protein] dehydratase
MPPKPFVDLASVDLSRVVAGPEEIRKCNPQRFEMEQLHGIILMDMEQGIIVGFRDVAEDEFWVRGHIPGRPLMPGVLMCEAAAQLCSYYYQNAISEDRFLGFGGMTDVKFRGAVVPGDRLVLVGRKVRLSRRQATFDVQGFVGGTMVYESTIIGLPM